ncbi:hypothetical protein Taro_051099 [Colocasia esculenta]|uniref:Uncharacterized protein n=1 Tax=Colocasia esculenta TaxID=4460 RepID=A0A843XF36_COLES|nr:hypothetical protein [Colocasia esculenta]
MNLIKGVIQAKQSHISIHLTETQLGVGIGNADSKAGIGNADFSVGIGNAGFKAGIANAGSKHGNPVPAGHQVAYVPFLSLLCSTLLSLGSGGGGGQCDEAEGTTQPIYPFLGRRKAEASSFSSSCFAPPGSNIRSAPGRDGDGRSFHPPLASLSPSSLHILNTVSAPSHGTLEQVIPIAILYKAHTQQHRSPI